MDFLILPGDQNMGLQLHRSLPRQRAITMPNVLKRFYFLSRGFSTLEYEPNNKLLFRNVYYLRNCDNNQLLKIYPRLLLLPLKSSLKLTEVNATCNKCWIQFTESGNSNEGDPSHRVLSLDSWGHQSEKQHALLKIDQTAVI